MKAERPNNISLSSLKMSMSPLLKAFLCCIFCCYFLKFRCFFLFLFVYFCSCFFFFLSFFISFPDAIYCHGTQNKLLFFTDIVILIKFSLNNSTSDGDKSRQGRWKKWKEWINKWNKLDDVVVVYVWREDSQIWLTTSFSSHALLRQGWAKEYIKDKEN